MNECKNLYNFVHERVVVANMIHWKEHSSLCRTAVTLSENLERQLEREMKSLLLLSQLEWKIVTEHIFVSALLRGLNATVFVLALAEPHPLEALPFTPTRRQISFFIHSFLPRGIRTVCLAV